MSDARQTETKINQTSRSQNPRAQRCVPRKVRIETLVPRFGDRDAKAFCHRHNPLIGFWSCDPFLFRGILVATSCLRSGSPLPRMDQARASRASLVVFAQAAPEWSSETLGSDLSLHCSSPKRAFMLNQRINGDWVFPVEESTRIRAQVHAGPREGSLREGARDTFHPWPRCSGTNSHFSHEKPSIKREIGVDFSRHNLEEVARPFFHS